MEEKIELTQQEYEDLKDTIKFRECVILKLKALKGIPDRVRTVETKVWMLMWGIPIVSVIVFGIFKLVVK